MNFTRDVDWGKEWENWSNEGRRVVEENCKHQDGISEKGWCEKCEVYEDSNEPMMNYAYPLETTPEDKDILEVCEKTACTVMHNQDEDEYYLALCGGGMDLSQDIALAYTILEKWIPFELALQVSTQDGLSKGGKNFRRVMRACKESIKKDMGWGKERLKRINGALKGSLQKSRDKKAS